MMTKKLSVVIITKNEEEMILGCLKSALPIADEIIVVDDFSQDETRKIARKFARKIYQHKFTGFAHQKNFGIKKASGDWILILDADERISQKLATQIKKILKSKQNYLYQFPRVNYFLGKRMDHGGWQHDRVERLFPKNKAIYANQQIHEYLKTKLKIKFIDAPLYHFSHRNIASNLLKTYQYAKWDAHYHFVRRSPPVTKWSLFKGVIDHFYLRYVKQRGYKDGTEGFIEAMYQAFSYVLIIQSMLWEKQRGKTSQQLYQALDQKLAKNNFNLEQKN